MLWSFNSELVVKKLYTIPHYCHYKRIKRMFLCRYFDSSGISGPIPSTFANLINLETVYIIHILMYIIIIGLKK